ncbi:hypothetical protein [Mycolicibacterium mengxianglii]|uniref:hypothetical protein n=1 Tax=Mycolicibacterium mengxianglii TaxID=2736649 RepID=UPI0018D1ACA9|nr:hypothetical protein [Mycolicibacterium mengxianglii]
MTFGSWPRGAPISERHCCGKLVEDLPGVNVTQPAPANAVFAIVTPKVEKELRRIANYQYWSPGTGEVRWMCFHENSDETVHGFADALSDLIRTTAPTV